MCAVEGDPYNEGMRLLKRRAAIAPTTPTRSRSGILDAGFVFVGRTNTPELGLVPTTEPEAYGPTRNPWDTGRTTGGSSGGSAAAVASGMVAVAHANDGGGSIRIPASCCGLVGLKPSRGRTSLGPDFTASSTTCSSTSSCVTRTVRDTAGVLDVVHGADGRRPGHARRRQRGRSATRSAPTRARCASVCITHNPLGDRRDPSRLRRGRARTPRGCSSRSVTRSRRRYRPRSTTRRSSDTSRRSGAATLAYNLRYWDGRSGRDTPADVEPLTWSLAEMGRATAAADYVEAQHACVAARPTHRRVVGRATTCCSRRRSASRRSRSATFGTPDEPLLGFIRAATFVPYTPLANITGQPAISLPLPWNADNLPIGVAARWARTAAKTCCSGSRRSSKRRGRGPTAATGACLTPWSRSRAVRGSTATRPTAVDALLAEGVDYLCLEALAELTLAILQKDRQRDETRGYTRDLPAYLARALPFVADGRTKIITNAGGINPDRGGARRGRDRAHDGRDGHQDRDRARRRRARAARHAAHATGTVVRASRHRRAVRRFPGAAAVRVRVPRRAPIVDALAQGADIVITGRVADASLFLAPLRCTSTAGRGTTGTGSPPASSSATCSSARARASAATTPATGGRSRTPGTCRIRSRRVDADGTAVISKPTGSGGRVSTDTLRHQLLYEVHDPTRYLVARCRRRLHVGALRRSARRPSAHHRRARHARRPTRTSCCSRPTPVGRAKCVSRSRGPTRTRRRRRRPRSSRSGSRWPASRSTSGASSTGVSTRSAGRLPCRGDRITNRRSACCASRGGATTSAPRASVGRELVPLTLSAPPAGLTGAGRGGRGGATELLVDLADAHRQARSSTNRCGS